jgi:RNA polymerase sigma-70 factor (ECF subfamily)
MSQNFVHTLQELASFPQQRRLSVAHARPAKRHLSVKIGTESDEKAEAVSNTSQREDRAYVIDEKQSAIWLVAAQAGDATAANALIEHYSGPIYGMIYRMVRSREEAEDLTQETFLKIFSALDRVDPARSFKCWAFKIAYNTTINLLRKKQRRGQHLSLDWDDGEDGALECPEALRVDMRTTLEQRELGAQLDELLALLPNRVAMLFVLYYKEGLSIAEICAVAEMNESAVKVAMFRARKQMREWLLEGEA